MLKSNHYEYIYQNEETDKWHYVDETSAVSDEGFDTEEQAVLALTEYVELQLHGSHEMFLQGWRGMTNRVEANVLAHGFRDRATSGKRNQGELIALMHSELSEALEAIRKPGPSNHIPEFKGVEEELADVIIRIMDFDREFDLRIAEAIEAKHRFNMTRPFKHGKAF